jgi:hypothetical protein
MLSQFPNDLMTNYKVFGENLMRLSLEKNFLYLKEVL